MKSREERNAYMREWRVQNREKFHTSQKRCYQRIRLEALQHYSAETPFCACCGETELVFLTIDHINNDGADHRRAIGMRQGRYEPKESANIGGNGFAYWLKKNDWPTGFQILCFNCNWAKSHGGCPHNTLMQRLIQQLPKEQSHVPQVPLQGPLH